MALTIIMLSKSAEGQLREDFYSKSCPNVESIVKQAVTFKLTQTLITVQATLRLFFHDCFVEVLSFPSYFIFTYIFLTCLAFVSRENRYQRSLPSYSSLEIHIIWKVSCRFFFLHKLKNIS